jgi:hypothetical protein
MLHPPTCLTYIYCTYSTSRYTNVFCTSSIWTVACSTYHLQTFQNVLAATVKPCETNYTNTFTTCIHYRPSTSRLQSGETQITRMSGEAEDGRRRWGRDHWINTVYHTCKETGSGAAASIMQSIQVERYPLRHVPSLFVS